MNQPGCRKEPLVLEAARHGLWDEELRGHVSGCRNCAGAAAALIFLRQLRLHDHSGAALPGADQMWWKMQLRARREAIERAARPVSLLQSIMLILAALSFGGACVWQQELLRNLFGSLIAAWHLNPAPLQEFAVNMWNSWSLFLVGGSGAVAILAALVVWLARAED